MRGLAIAIEKRMHGVTDARTPRSEATKTGLLRTHPLLRTPNRRAFIVRSPDAFTDARAQRGIMNDPTMRRS